MELSNAKHLHKPEFFLHRKISKQFIFSKKKLTPSSPFPPHTHMLLTCRRGFLRGGTGLDDTEKVYLGIFFEEVRDGGMAVRWFKQMMAIITRPLQMKTFGGHHTGRMSLYPSLSPSLEF